MSLEDAEEGSREEAARACLRIAGDADAAMDKARATPWGDSAGLRTKLLVACLAIDVALMTREREVLKEYKG